MDDYFFPGDMLDKFNASSDWIKALALVLFTSIILAPFWVVTKIALAIIKLSKDEPKDPDQDSSPLYHFDLSDDWTGENEADKPLPPKVRALLEARSEEARKARQTKIDEKLAKVLDDEDFWSCPPRDGETEAEAASDKPIKLDPAQGEAPDSGEAAQSDQRE